MHMSALRLTARSPASNALAARSCACLSSMTTAPVCAASAAPAAAAAASSSAAFAGVSSSAAFLTRRLFGESTLASRCPVLARCRTIAVGGQTLILGDGMGRITAIPAMLRKGGATNALIRQICSGRTPTGGSAKVAAAAAAGAKRGGAALKKSDSVIQKFVPKKLKGMLRTYGPAALCTLALVDIAVYACSLTAVATGLNHDRIVSIVEYFHLQPLLAWFHLDLSSVQVDDADGADGGTDGRRKGTSWGTNFVLAFIVYKMVFPIRFGLCAVLTPYAAPYLNPMLMSLGIGQLLGV